MRGCLMLVLLFLTAFSHAQSGAPLLIPALSANPELSTQTYTIHSGEVQRIGSILRTGYRNKAPSVRPAIFLQHQQPRITRGQILLKNLLWSSLTGLLLGTAAGLKVNENDATVKNVLFFTAVGGGIGFSTGLVIGAVKAAKRQDDVFF